MAKPADIVATARFHFTNAGKSPITVTDVTTTCGCTSAKADKSTYRPGESGAIAVEFLFGDRVGLQQKTITVKTITGRKPADDKSGGETATFLHLVVDIPKLVEIEPETVSWSVGEESRPKTVRLRFLTEGPVTITSAKTVKDRVVAKVKEIVPGKEYEIDLLSNGLRVYERGPVEISTDSTVARLKGLVIDAVLLPAKAAADPRATPPTEPTPGETLHFPFRITPDRLTWKVGESSTPKSFDLKPAPDVAPVKITGARSAGDQFKLTLQENGDGSYRLTLIPKTTANEHSGVIMLETDEPADPDRFKMRVVGTVEAGDAAQDRAGR